MAPTSRIILTRHAQAEHNVDLDYSIHDAPLTALGKRQALALAPQISSLAEQVDLVVSSPLKRTLQTTRLGWSPAVDCLGGWSKVIALPQAQECNAHPCDTGSPRAVLDQDPEIAGCDFALLDSEPEWTSKRGFWAPDAAAIKIRTRWVRQWLRDRPEETIVLVAHGDVLRQITASAAGPSEHMWRNAEARMYIFDPRTVDSEECFLIQKEDVAIAGGYAPTSTDIDVAEAA